MPVILCVGYETHVVTEEHREARTLVLLKPYRPCDLVARIQELLERGPVA